MVKGKVKGWNWLDWLGLIVYLVAWCAVLGSMIAPSRFTLGGYEIRPSVFGLIGAVTLSVILLAVFLSGFKFGWALYALFVVLFFTFAPINAHPANYGRCPILIYAIDSNGAELVLQNGSSYPNLVEFAIVHRAKNRSHGNLCVDWKQIFDAFCCWYGGCRPFYSYEEGLFTLKMYPISNRTFLLMDEGLEEMYRVSVTFGSKFIFRCEYLGSPSVRRDWILWSIAILIFSGNLAHIAKLWRDYSSEEEVSQ